MSEPPAAPLSTANDAVNAFAALHAHALAALGRGDWIQAYRLAAQADAQHPGHPSPNHIGGVAALQLGRIPLAIAHLRIAAEAQPAHADALGHYARALAMAHRMDDAMAAADRAALAADPGDAALWDMLGVVYSKANAHEQACQAFERAVAAAPADANHRFNLATSHMYFGRLDEAEREFEACVRLDAGYWRGHLALAQLRRQTPERNHLARLRVLLDRAPGDVDARLHLHLATAKELEDLGRDTEAFAHYQQGKAAWRRVSGYTPAQDEALFDAIERRFTHVPPGAPGHPNREPIFVLGMPRSGTTLVDRILSSHPQVQSAGELGNFPAALHRAGGERGRSLAGMVECFPPDFDDWAGLGRAYVDSTRPLTGGLPRFVDKLPHNFLFAGFIARALPDVPIVLMRRHPMDTCLSNFRQLFAPESAYHAYSFDLLDIGRYYLRFDRLVRRWMDLFPGRILELRYEDLVDDQAGTTRRVLEYCGLPWDEACLRFDQAGGAVPTASAAQVRASMTRDYLQRWRRYGPALDELRALLADGGVQVD